MKLLLSHDSFHELILGTESSKKGIRGALEALTKKNVLFYLSLSALEGILASESDSVKKEILWTQSKSFFADLLPLRKEEISLALKLSISKELDWKNWTDIALASLLDLDGVLAKDPIYRKQSLIKVLLAQEIDLDGFA
ncbi:hypothetical protein LEP1GSC047_1175 [Leptospira inadai serovar Lyme str. 10]|uniref:PIN domain-containing protein n=2 Tax=Leptospira inadai serovar Lyme TaxID=293084 RepID=V6H9U7_9LEPT|nr:hypothetical protein [Leptospira inadai]EQA35003.1 hypothetical protein LEP1GSC047_1175 [Leptospira inadai serovar Lyme str. 10]PNV75922.1 hypothetical protein BES34_005275 [Leptospira inadai serovar Lyme]